MNIIATLGIIYISLHNHGLSEYEFVTAVAQGLLLHTNSMQGEGQGGEYQVSYSSSTLCVVLAATN